ncbi:ABC transporter permease [Tessaracoccus aquimaris]|uniref:ABC transporter permease n=1 Tax=Tessaracoccus aquimaris TaxID=1332264 RepID=A0A1Q2CSU2_9ACTN|nr:ABC transporter permease [Tessaracoccus aquimaris]
MIYIALLLVGPLAYTAFLSLTDARGSIQADFSFVGIQNYLTALTADPRFWPAAGRTLIFTAGALIAEMILGMVVALALHARLKTGAFVRITFLLPLVATPVAVAMMWLLIFEPTIGFANEALGWLGIPAQGWISEPATALPTLMLVDVWQWTPMVILILSAGLANLPQDQQEAAMVDGASGWNRFWHITLPTIWPTVMAAVLLRGIDAMKTFDLLYVTKGAGGGSRHEAETLNVYAYAQNFSYNDYGAASAISILFFAFIAIVIGILNGLGNKR